MINLHHKVHVNAYPFKGEHLVSLMARHHLYSGFKRYSASVGLISDDYKKQTPHEIIRSLYLDTYNAFNPDMDYRDFLGKFTLYPYYEPFIPSELKYNNGSSRLIAKKVYKVNFADEWRHCQKCAEEDLDTVGVTYYHSKHQLPGMTICLKHNHPLRVACRSCHKKGRYLDKIGMPHPNQCPDCNRSYQDLDGYMDDDIFWLLQSSEKLLVANSNKLDLIQLQKNYRNFLNLSGENKSLTVSDQKRITEVQNALNDFYPDKLYEALFLPTPNDKNYKFSGMGVYPMAYHSRSYLPLCHLLLIRMLFGKLENIPI